MRSVVGIAVISAGAVLGLAGPSSEAAAQTVLPAVDSIVAALAPESAGPMVRSIAGAGALPFTGEQPIPAGFDFPAFSFQVGFDTGSHVLTTEGMTALRSIAAALLDGELAGSRFQVGAHVVQGSGLNAMPVSARRAAVVAEHLTVFYGIPADRLVPVGYGNTKPLDVMAPDSGANERIEFINIDVLR